MKKVKPAALPELGHFTSADFEHVYEPSDDTYLLIDALASEKQVILQRQPGLCVEIGSGSGAVITHLATLLPGAHFIASDINQKALKATAATSTANGCSIAPVQADLLKAFRPGSVDILVFNPPYVPTSDEELAEAERTADVSAAWAGGERGRRVVDRLFPVLRDMLAPRGLFYLLGVAENDPEGIAALLESQYGFTSRLVAERRAQNERLFVMCFERTAGASS